MAVECDVAYLGELRCEAKHGPSAVRIVTDAPVDNHGRGESFSPTDLVGAALGTCLLTIVGIVAQRHGWNVSGVRAHVAKEMIQQPVRRIGRLAVKITFPAAASSGLGADDRARLETAARRCPVHQSLHPDIDAPIDFIYEE
jgi:putative redox protein